MDVVEETKEKAREVVSGGREKGSMTKRVLVSLAASAASGATAYGARKAPAFFQDKVLPKLKELTSNGGTLEKAKSAVESAVPGIGGDGGGGGQEGGGGQFRQAAECSVHDCFLHLEPPRSAAKADAGTSEPMVFICTSFNFAPVSRNA